MDVRHVIIVFIHKTSQILNVKHPLIGVNEIFQVSIVSFFQAFGFL